MLDGKQVSRFIGDEFVEIYQAVKEYTDLHVIFLQFLQGEVTFLLRLDHVVHLAQQVYEEDWLMVQIL
jgi:hypothetical protein